jgi:hypothetical protein
MAVCKCSLYTWAVVQVAARYSDTVGGSWRPARGQSRPLGLSHLGGCDSRPHVMLPCPSNTTTTTTTTTTIIQSTLPTFHVEQLRRKRRRRRRSNGFIRLTFAHLPSRLHRRVRPAALYSPTQPHHTHVALNTSPDAFVTLQPL